MNCEETRSKASLTFQALRGFIAFVSQRHTASRRGVRRKKAVAPVRWHKLQA
jgi:hypothetical protein